jgi:hypothetical protein
MTVGCSHAARATLAVDCAPNGLDGKSLSSSAIGQGKGAHENAAPVNGLNEQRLR